MKKILSICLILLLVFQLSACSGLHPIAENEPKLATTFENDLDVVENDIFYYQPNDYVYLLKDKFIYADLDESDNNTWGTPRKLKICDLKTGEITSPISVPMGEINYLCVLNNKLYFITTATRTETGSNLSLFCYDLEQNTLETIYETPDSILPYISSNTLYYIGYNKSGNIFYKYNGSESEIISENIPLTLEYINAYDNDGIYVYNYNKNKYLHLQYNGDIVEVDFEVVKKADKTLPESNNEINNLLISARFGNYYILEDKIPPNENEDEDACGYKYTINYYLYDINSKETSELSSASYWYYYI
ncbi:MAG: hypothetical protein K2G56_04100 [Eubacterium sp.]|nr:hypothetical protein [Eubacterium sp.]